MARVTKIISTQLLIIDINIIVSIIKYGKMQMKEEKPTETSCLLLKC